LVLLIIIFLCFFFNYFNFGMGLDGVGVGGGWGSNIGVGGCRVIGQEYMGGRRGSIGGSKCILAVEWLGALIKEKHIS
jgi:hypothetical protein